MLVGIANIIDTQILQNGAAIRTAVVFFYLANEGLSCLENAAVIGLPVPEKRSVESQWDRRRKTDVCHEVPV